MEKYKTKTTLKKKQTLTHPKIEPTKFYFLIQKANVNCRRFSVSSIQVTHDFKDLSFFFVVVEDSICVNYI